MEITKREAIASIAIISVMLIFGFILSGKIQDNINDANVKYYKAVHIENTDLFQYGMDTNVGNAFVHGDLVAVDTVGFDEIPGEYMYVKKVEEHYNRHTRTVTKTRTVNGKTQTYTETEVYWSWDYHDSWEKHSDKISFCGVEFDYRKIQMPSSLHVDTIKESSRVRYCYYGVNTKHTGTIYTKLSNKTISNNSRFFNNCGIDKSLEICTSSASICLFWVFWMFLSGAIIYFFYCAKNRWLE